MTEQEAFETWLKDNNIFQYEDGEYRDPIDMEVLKFSSMVWQACAGRKDKTIENLKLELATANKLHEDCASKLYDKDAEIRVLRRFVKWLYERGKIDNAQGRNNYFLYALKTFDFIDENNKPTRFLTGEGE